MDDFDVIEFGYNAADETINFGTRCLADGDNLYEVSTLATLKRSKPIDRGAPHMNCVVHAGQIYFSTDGTMRIFQDLQCSDVVFNVAFEAIIDSFCVSQGGEYLLVCLRDGMVHLIDCKDEFNSIFSESCKRDENDEDCGGFFINSFHNDDYFLLVTKLGQVYKIIFPGDCRLDSVYEFNFRTEIASFQFPFLLVNGTELAILDFENNNAVSDPEGGWDFKKIFPLDYMFFALDSQENLFRICATTLLIFPINNTTQYKDMHMLSDENERLILAVTEEAQQNQLQLLSYPDLNKLYSIKVSNQIHLISLECLNDEVLYISKILNDDSVAELRFHVVNETQPELRLKRLLKKRKYEEAEKFARLFRLDPALIDKSKAQEIVDRTVCTAEDVDDLLRLLAGVDDDEFRLQCCVDVESSCARFQDAEKVLSYGCRLQLKRRERMEAAEAMQTSLALVKHRSDTFAALFRGREPDVQAWVRFSTCSLIEEVQSLLRNYQIEEAKIIYSRLDEDTLKQLTETHVSGILGILNNLSITVYRPFLPIFISITLSVLPSTLPLFVKWTHGKVFHLEKRAKGDFPNNAIKFTLDIVQLMRVDDTSDISFQRQCDLHRDSLVGVSSLLTTLQMLKTLKDEYRISVPVAGYLSGPENVVRILLNNEMPPEEYDVFLKRFLCKYMVENHMEPNEVLLREITDLMGFEECVWMNIVESILNCISSVSVKLEAVRTILDLATVPWSDTVRRIAHEALKHPNHLTAEIREQVAHEPMQVVLRKPRYKIRDRRIPTLNDLRFVLNRIIYCGESTMVEDVYGLCEKPEYRHVANMLLATHFIKQGSLEKAMNVLDDNTPEEILNCSRELAVAVETVVNIEMGLSDELPNNYYEAAGSIFRRLNDGESNEVYRKSNEKTLDLIRNVHNLHRTFQIKSTTYELRDERKRDAIVDGVLEEVRCQLEAGLTAVDGALAACQKLAMALSLDKNEVMMRLCAKSGNYNVIVEVAQRFCDCDASAVRLSAMAVLLLRYVGSYKLRVLDTSSSDSESSLLLTDAEPQSLVDDAVFCKGLQVADVVMSKALAKASPDEVLQCLEVHRWVNAAFYITRSHNCELGRQLFGDLYESASVLPGSLTFSTIKNVFLAFCGYTGGLSGADKNPNARYLTRFNTATLTEEEFIKELSILPPVLENMFKEGQHFTSYRVLQTLIESIVQLPRPVTAALELLDADLKKRSIPRVLSSILANSVIDTDLLYNLLLLGDRGDSTKFLVNSWKMYKRHPRKLACLSRTGLRLWDFYKITTGEAQMRKALVDIKWWRKMEGKKFDYDAFFKMKPEERFEFLVNSDCLDVALAQEYCTDFQLDPKASYRYFLRKIFVNWRPECEIKNDGNRRYLVVKNSEDDVLKKCSEVMESMNSSEVVKIVTGVWGTVNFYHYEVFIAMLNVLSQINPQSDNHTKRAMLIFLKNYRRVSRPSEIEVEQWYTNFPDTQSVDALSEFRLAFTQSLFTQQIFDIIRPELNLQTYKLWFGAIDILQPYLNTDKICSVVVKDVVASGILLKDATDEWVLHPKHEDLFKEIDECVRNITSLELITSVVYHLVMHTPKGADQVNAAQMCYRYAIQYRKRNPNSSDIEKAVTKVEKKYFTYAAMHILHTYNLTEARYVNLVAQQRELIMSLYLDERILRKNELDLHCPEINQAAEALATLFGLDIKKIRFDLIHSSLGSDNSSAPLDFDASMIHTNGDQSDDDILNRIAYVCSADDVERWRVKLFEMGLGDGTEDQRSVHCKARVLKVFTMIADAEYITNVTGLTYVEFTNYIDKLTIVSNLQYLGIALDVEALDGYSKKELLNRLVQRAGNTLTIKTMALICMTYALYDVKYWEFIVNTTISMSSFAELKTYVRFLDKLKYHYKSFYVKAWQKLIDHSFTSLLHSEQLDRVLLANFLTIQSCPVLNSLNFDNAFKRCMDRDKAEFAAVLLQYLDAGRRDEYAKEIRSSNRDLGASLNNLDQNGLCGIPYVKRILEGEVR